MSLINEQYLRDTFKIHKDVSKTRIVPYLVAASRKLKTWVGADVYADMELTDVLRLAEGCLAMHFLTLNLNTNVRPQGLVKVEKVEGNTTLQYLSPQETAQISAQWFEQAEQIVREFVPENLPSGIAVASLDAGIF